MSDKKFDWKGEKVPENEPDDKEILVWEITPHFNPNFDTLWVRDWYEMQDLVIQNFPMQLENVGKEELLNGTWKMTFKLAKTTVGDYNEMMSISETEYPV